MSIVANTYVINTITLAERIVEERLQPQAWDPDTEWWQDAPTDDVDDVICWLTQQEDFLVVIIPSSIQHEYRKLSGDNDQWEVLTWHL